MKTVKLQGSPRYKTPTVTRRKHQREAEYNCAGSPSRPGLSSVSLLILALLFWNSQLIFHFPSSKNIHKTSSELVSRRDSASSRSFQDLVSLADCFFQNNIPGRLFGLEKTALGYGSCQIFSIIQKILTSIFEMWHIPFILIVSWSLLYSFLLIFLNVSSL